MDTTKNKHTSEDKEDKIEIKEEDHENEEDVSYQHDSKNDSNSSDEQELNKIDESDSNIIPPEITLFDLKTKRLQHLFNKEYENFERSLNHFKKTNLEIDYK